VPRAGLPSWVLLTLVLTLTFAAYSGSLSFRFVHDDRGQIVEDPAVDSWRSVPSYFTGHVWAAVYPGELGNYYRPLFLLWLRLNDALFDSHPWGWHLTSVLAHLVVTLLVYFLSVRIVEEQAAAAFVALIFGLHPVHIEAVAWVSGVTEPLLATLILGSFLCYLRMRDRPMGGRRWLALSLALYALGLLEKESALVMPLIVFAYDALFRFQEGNTFTRRGWVRRVGRALRSAAPYFALIPPYLLARYYALKGLSHIVTPLPFSSLVYTWPKLFWF
jgi:hypothetical protein